MSTAYLRSLIQGNEWQEGSSDEAELRRLAELAGGPQIKTIGEIGFNAGLSAHNFLDANSDALLYSFDIGEHEWVRPAADHIAQMFPGRFELTYGDSLQTVPEFQRRHPEVKFDLIFIDGGHDYEVARQDLLNMRDLAHPKTVLVFDDVVPWKPYGIGPARAWADLLEEGAATCDELWQEGRRAEVPTPPGQRVWVVGRYLDPDDARSLDPQQRARDLMLAKSMRNDARSAFWLAQAYFDKRDFVNAREQYARRAKMGGWDEEVYYSMYRLAESMARLEEPWPDVQAAYLKAWEFRPTRAEPLYAIASRYRADKRPRLGYQFAKLAAQIPLPEQDTFLVRADMYAWLATDEQAICAYWIGKHAEAFTLYRRLLARPDIPDGDRQRMARNRDFSVPAMLDAASAYPDTLVDSLIAGPRDIEVTVSLIAGPNPAATEQTLNSFLHCCTDLSRVGHFLVLDAGLSAQDRAKLLTRYGFIEFVQTRPGDRPAAHLVQLRSQIHERFWLHLGHGWRFFAPENLITRLTAVLDTETQVFQVGINLADAAKLTGTSATEQQVRRTPDAGRYLLTDTVANGPAMFDTTRLDQTRGLDDTDPTTATALHTASLDEVLCISTI